MTREEAINYLEMSMAIGEDDDSRYHNEVLEFIIKSLEQQPCEDCVNRQAVIDEMGDTNMDIYTEEVKDFVRSLPPVTPQPKVGEWLEKEINSDKIEEWQSARCSVCDKYHTTPYMYYFSHYEYCPHCGSKMEGRQKVDKGRSKRNR